MGIAGTVLDHRVKCRPLTEEQRALVAVEPAWLAPWVNRCVPPGLIRRVGWDECLAEARRLLVVSASIWNPADGRTVWRSFAMGGIKRFLPATLRRRAGRARVWGQMPEPLDDAPDLASQLPDHRAPEGDPLLRVWCSEGARRQRRRLDWRGRIVLYLRFVECWGVRECSAALGLSKQRVSQLEHRSIAKLERVRGAGSNAE